MLIKKGYHVIIFAGSFLHYNKSNSTTTLKIPPIKIRGQTIRFHKNSILHFQWIKRIFSIFLFAWRLLYYRKKFPKADIVIHNLRVPFDFPVYVAARKLKLNSYRSMGFMAGRFCATGLMKPKNPIY